MDKSVVIVGGRERAIRGLNGNGKNHNKIKILKYRNSTSINYTLKVNNKGCQTVF